MRFFKNSDRDGLLDSRQLGRVHSASLEILRDSGMAFGSPEALDVFKAHGLKVSGETVFFTDRVIEKSLEMVPGEFTLAARNPEHDIDFSPEVQALGPGGGSVYAVDSHGRVSAPSKEDFIRAAKLTQVLPRMKFCRPLFIPRDLAADRLQTWMMVKQVLLQDKPYYLMNAADVPVLALAFGLTEDEMRESALIGRVCGLSSINVMSPLYMAEEACRNILAFCRAGVTFNISSMPSAGSTAPCSLTSALVVQNCENLGGLVLSQLVSPGHPVFYGAMGGHSDMRTLGAVYGGPENRVLAMAGSQMAAYYGLLSRGYAGTPDAPAGDFQAGAESMFQFFSSALQRVNLLPGCGHLGSFMGGSLEKMVLDAEICEYVSRLTEPLKFGEDDLAVEVIREVGPKGNFLNHPHTFKRFRTEFHYPAAFQRTPYERWRREGSLQVMDLAQIKLESHLDSYRTPDIDPDLKKRLEALIS